MYSKQVFALAVLAAAVVAQESGSETSTAAGSIPSISPCVLGCITEAATTGGCSSFTDLSCVCTSTDFQTAAAQCLQDKCTADEQAAALALQQQECANVSGAPSSTESGAPSTTGAASTTGTSSKPTSTAPTSSKPATSSAATSAAATSNAAVKMGPMTGLLAVVAGFIGVAL